MTNRTKFVPVQVTGHCDNNFHDKCRGALRRPRDPKTNAERAWRCQCDCHAGQVLELEPEPEKAAPTAKEMKQYWGEQLMLLGHVEVDLPADEKEVQDARNKLHYAAWARDLKITTRVKDGKIVAKVKEAKK
jgi:hypothetical protein